MMEMNNSIEIPNKRYFTIGEVSKITHIKTHILRYWEKQFYQIRPTILKKRRYYSEKQIRTVKLVKYLLKEKGMTINGVKNVLKSKINNLDDYNSYSLKAEYYKKNIKAKSKTILEKIKKIKSYGKKDSH